MPLLLLVFSFSLLAQFESSLFTGDEFYYARQLFEGKLLHTHHLLSTFDAWGMWKICTLIGHEVSPMRALQLTSSFFASLAFVGVVTFGRQLGFNRAKSILWAIPFLLLNGVVRYGLSAYPDAGALAGAIWAVNGLYWACMKGSKPAHFFGVGILVGLMGLLHALAFTFAPAFVIALYYFKREKFTQLTVSLGLGFCTVVLPLYLLWWVGAHDFSNRIEYPQFHLIMGSQPPSLKLATTTFLALFIPGVHVENRFFDLILNLPRLIAVLFTLGTFYFGFKSAGTPSDRLWQRVFLIAFLCLFFVLTMLYSYCRQYSLILLAVYWPLFLISIKRLERHPFFGRSRIWACGLSTVFLIHTAFGVEGLRYLLFNNPTSMVTSESQSLAYSAMIFFKPAPAPAWVRESTTGSNQ